MIISDEVLASRSERRQIKQEIKNQIHDLKNLKAGEACQLKKGVEKERKQDSKKRCAVSLTESN